MTEAAGQENHAARDAHMLGPGRKRILALDGCRAAWTGRIKCGSSMAWRLRWRQTR